MINFAKKRAVAVNVYSHFTKLNDAKGFRWGTILQFGSSWSVIGSVVMKNPGSSACGNKVDDKSILDNLKSFQSPEDDWYEFSVDDTMRKVAMLFQYKKGTKSIDSLNGVILIFNLFYYSEADFGKAIQMNTEYKLPEDVISNDVQLLQEPVYLGFSRELAHHKDFTDRAKVFFDRTIILGMKCYNLDFAANTFLHPQYLMGVGKNQKASIEMLAKFKTNDFAPSEDEVNAAAAFMQNESLSISDWDVLFCHLCEWLVANLSFLKTETNPKDAEISQLTWIRFHISQSCSFQIVRQKSNNAQYVRFVFSQRMDNVTEYLESQGYCKEENTKQLQFKRKRQEFPNSIIWTALEIYSVLSEIIHFISKSELR
ncbi:MAG: hypothetical protein NC406_05715 [Bacteroides sp.]|nr:hypothetical protein [Bacteroides sp.]